MKPLLLCLVSIWLSPQLCDAALNPPIVTPAGGIITAPSPITLANPNATGTVFFTLDGNDPRNVFGHVATTARPYENPISANRPLEIQARVKSGTEWSTLVVAAFTTDQDFSKLLFTEVMFHPQDSSDRGEFVELKNVGNQPLDLSGLEFAAVDSGILEAIYTFPNHTIVPPGSFFILVSNPAKFHEFYPDVPVNANFIGELSNSGVPYLSIRSQALLEVASAHYETTAPWQVVPDNHGYFPDDALGFSLVRVNHDPEANAADYREWRASTYRTGSPGSDEPPPIIPKIYVNELLARSSHGAPDAVEFYNPNAFSVDISYWWLSDERNDPPRYSIPIGTIVPANGYLVMDETQFGQGPNGIAFRAEGERCYLFSADENGVLTGYSHGFQFPTSDPDVTFGRVIASDGTETFAPQSAASLGSANSGPAISAVVISEIMFHPPAGELQFIEFANTSNVPVNMWDPQSPQNTWMLNSRLLPQNATVPAQGFLLLVEGNPEIFRTRYSVPPSVPIFSLPELISHNPTSLVFAKTSSVNVDTVEFSDHFPWPSEADGGGASLERINLHSYGSEPANWRASPAGSTPGRANSGNLPPLVWAGSDRVELVAQPTPLASAIVWNAWPASSFSAAWEQLAGPQTATLTGPSSAATTALFPAPGQYTLRLTANNGTAIVSDTVVITVVVRQFNLWQQAVFTPAERNDLAISGPLADPDGDGRLNLTEYLFSSSPKVVDRNGIAAGTVDGHLHIRWTERANNPDVVAFPERADFPNGPWFRSQELFDITETALPGGIREFVARERLPIDGRAQGFLRLGLRVR